MSRAGFFTYVEQYLEFLAYAILAGMVTHQDVGQQTEVPYISPRVRHRIRGNPRRKSRMKTELQGLVVSYVTLASLLLIFTLATFSRLTPVVTADNLLLVLTY